MKYEITGGKKLEGSINISGNKNSVFPCVSAALLTQEEVILENIPALKDTEILIKILKKLGVSLRQEGSTLIINASSIKHFTLPEELMTKLRGSIVLVGSILSRMGKATFYHPGGDIIGQRSIEAHLNGFRQLGALVKKVNLKYSVESLKESDSFDIFLHETSVTATENLILASVLGNKVTTLRNCAKEPHVVDLCRMLIQMGAKIENIGTDMLKITGVKMLHGTKYRIGVDFIEVGTYAIAAAITKGKIQINNLDKTDLDPIELSLKQFGLIFEKKDDKLTVFAERLKSPRKLTTNIWPGFPTDLMSAAIVLATQSKGVILCHDWMYEGRMFFTDKLISMGAEITLADPHRVFVYGPMKLRARVLDTPDIRAGMALVLAALVARGKSIINQAELIERGYEDVVVKLKSLGAQIEQVL